MKLLGHPLYMPIPKGGFPFGGDLRIGLEKLLSHPIEFGCRSGGIRKRGVRRAFTEVSLINQLVSASQGTAALKPFVRLIPRASEG